MPGFNIFKAGRFVFGFQLSSPTEAQKASNLEKLHGG
jgi:hypothetical protein